MKRLPTVMLVVLIACGADVSIDTSASASSGTTPALDLPTSTTVREPSETTIELIPSKEDPPTTTVESEEPRTTVPPDSENAALQQLVDLATDDLAARLGQSAAVISVVSAEAMVWPDHGLGCPEPGMAYIQVPVDGALIVLAVDGNEYRYHSGGKVTVPFLCEN